MASTQLTRPVTDAPIVDETATTCVEGSGGSICRWVYDLTGSETAADVTMWVVERPLKLLLLLALGWLVIWLGKRAIHGFVVKVPEGMRRRGLTPTETRAYEERAARRSESVERLLVSGLKFLVWFVVLVMVLDVVGVNVGPLIVSAGILGLALSLGAQTLIRDLIGGVSIVLDDRFAVGDDVDLADASGRVGATGRVEDIRLSSTTIRDDAGEIWHVPNGDIRWVGNLSQHWSRIAVDVRIAYGSDLPAAKDALASAIVSVCADERYRDAVIEPPGKPFVRLLADDAAVLRASVRVKRGRHDAVKAALLERVAEALPEAEVGPALPRQVVLVRERPERAATG